MTRKVGIRREDKNRWERRTPFVPEDVKNLANKYDLQFLVQPSPIRIFTDSDYESTGAEVTEDLQLCHFIFAVKEIPEDLLFPNKVYVYFSHTIKGQAHNMPMLQKLMELNCTLIDYELVADDKGRRLIFFGNYAGLAGMIDTFWALGRRLSEEGIDSPFLNIDPAHNYHDLNAAKEAITKAGEEIRRNGLPKSLCPAVFGFAGYGNVSKGAQEIFDLMPHQTIGVEDLMTDQYKNLSEKNILYKVEFKEEDMVVPKEKGKKFDLQEYYKFPERYDSIFESYLPFLTVLLNCIYWDPKYPRLVSKKAVKKLFQHSSPPRLRMIGDISCDVEGAVECTVKCSILDQPVYVYDTQKDQAIDGVKGNGPVILAIDHLPCELPRESSTFFSNMLKPFIPTIVKANYSKSFEELDLDPEIKNAVITHQGKLTPRFEYLKKYLQE
jgi:alpha-aminoadipic semialdehyde synthase